jgi:hypothetical protein
VASIGHKWLILDTNAIRIIHVRLLASAVPAMNMTSGQKGSRIPIWNDHTENMNDKEKLC